MRRASRRVEKARAVAQEQRLSWPAMQTPRAPLTQAERDARLAELVADVREIVADAEMMPDFPQGLLADARAVLALADRGEL